MNIFAKIAEQRIREAIENGEFENLKGMGKPLDLGDESWVPEDLRMAYKILKNSGCLPAERGGRVWLDSLKQFLSGKLLCLMPLPAFAVV